MVSDNKPLISIPMPERGIFEQMTLDYTWFCCDLSLKSSMIISLCCYNATNNIIIIILFVHKMVT